MTLLRPARALFLAVLALAPLPAWAGSRIAVTDAIMQPTMPGSGSTTIYLRITNTGEEDDRLLGASARDFAAVEIHEMQNEDGMMGMRPLIYGMKVEAGETLDLNPLTNHMMMINPRKRFRAGQKVPVTLHFLKAGAIRIEATVQPYRSTPHAGH